jgi:hypothetical protein
MAPVKIERAERPTFGSAGGGKIRRARPTDPDFDSIFDEGDGNPLDGLPEYDGDLQASSDREMSAVEAEIEANRAASAERFRIGTDAGYFCVLCFQTEAQKLDFLKAAKWDDLGDYYLNGLEIAHRLGVPIDVIPIEPRKLRANPQKFSKKEVIGNA